jgi:hypothetical protein
MGAIGDVAAALVSGKGGLSPEDSNNLENLSTNSKGFLDGINETKSIAQKQLNYVSDIAVDVGTKGWFAETLGKLVDNFEQSSQRDEEGQSLSESIKDILSDMKVFEETTANDNKEKKKKKGKVSDRTKLDDLKSLPYEYATLGAVLANVLSNKDEKKDKKGGISGFFKGLLEGVGGIAALGVALFAFAGATLLFTFVDWGKAVVGMLAFTVFTIGMVALAKTLNKEEKDLTNFAKTSLMLSAALGVFAVSLYLVSAVVGSKGVTIAGKEIVPPFSLLNAIAGTAVFLAFIAGVALVSKLVTKEQKDFEGFAKGALILSAALGVFALSLYIVSAVVGSNGITIAGKEIVPKFDLLDAVVGVGIFLVFLTALAGICRLAGNNQKDFVQFATASLLMTASLVAFTFALCIVSAVYSSEEKKIGDWTIPKVDIQGALIGLGLFLGFLLAFTGIAILANSFGGNIAMFTAVSLLMSVSLITFAVAMAITAGVVSGEGVSFGDIKFQPPKNAAVNALIGIGEMAAFMLAFAGLGALFLIPFAGQAMLAGIAMASGALLAIAGTTILFSKAMMLAGLAMTGGEAEIGGETYKLPKYNEAATEAMFDLMADFIDMFADLADDIGKKGMKAVEKLGKSVIPIINAMDKMVDVVIKAGENYDNIIKIVNGDSNALDHLMDPVMYVILGHKLDGKGGLAKVADEMGFWGAIVLKKVAESLVPIVDAMYKMIDVVIKAADNKQKITEMMNSEGGMQMIDHLLDPVIWMILGTNLDGSGGLMWVAENMSKRSAEVLKLVAEAMVPMIDAMDKMIDVVLKAATLSAEGQSTEELVATAMKNLDLIMRGNPVGTGFLPMFVAAAWALDDTSKDAIEAIKAMPSMVQALSDLVGVIAKAGELDPAKIDAGVYGLSAASNFLRTFVKTIADIIPGGVGGFFSSMFGGDPIDKLKDAHKYLQPGGVFYNIFQDLANIAKNFDGKGFENLGKVSIVGTFTTDMLKGSDNFKDIMKNIQKGIDNLSKPQAMTTVASALESISNAGDISHKFDPIYELIEKSVSIHSTAQDLESIANSYNKIAAAEKIGDMSSKFKGVFGIKSSTPSTAAAPVAAANNSRSSGMSIEEILNDWYENGVKIKQNLEGLPEEPKPVNLLSID